MDNQGVTLTMRKKLLTLLAAIVICSPTLAFAQLGQTAVLTGTVSDTSGAVLPGVTVTVASEAQIGGPRAAGAAAEGGVRFPHPAPRALKLARRPPRVGAGR